MSAQWKWTKRKYKAAWLYAEGKLTNEEICQETGIAERTFYRIIKAVEFQEQVTANLLKIEETIAANDIRIRNLVAQKLVDRLKLSGVPLSELRQLFLGVRKHKSEMEIKATIDHTHKTEISELTDGELDREIKQIEAYLQGYTNGQRAASNSQAGKGQKDS